MTNETSDPADLESSAASVLEKIGLTTEAAINLFYRQIVIHQGLPFSLRTTAEKPARDRADGDSRPPRKFDRDSRPPRRDGPPPRGRSFGDRDASRDDRPPRRDGPPRRSFGDRDDRGPRGDKPDFKKRRDFGDDRPPRRDREDDGERHRNPRPKTSSNSPYHGWRKDDSKGAGPKKRFTKGK